MVALRVLSVLFALTLCSVSVRSEAICDETFTSLQQLLDVIKAKAGLKVLPSDNTVVSYSDPATGFIWNFATAANPAYPSVACRRIVAVDGRYDVVTKIRCGASKDECDRLSVAYEDLDRRMLESLNGP